MEYDNLHTMLRLSDLLRTESRKAASAEALQLVHYDIINYIDRCNRYSDTPTALVDYLGLTKGTVSQTVSLLVKKRILQKKPDQKDLRISHLQLTEKGHQVLKNIRQTLQLTADRLYCSATYKKALDTVLKEMAWQLQEEKDKKPYGLCKTCRYNTQKTEDTYYCTLLDATLSATDTDKICREHQYST